jgi:uncharacterized protein HemY
MGDIAKILILLGVFLIVIGVILLLIGKVPFLGKLPGDVLIKKEHFTVYVPLTTGIIISILISLVLYLIGKLR